MNINKMKSIDELKESRLINSIRPHNLSCIDRPNYIVVESIKGIEVYLYLFFNKFHYDFLNHDTANRINQFMDMKADPITKETSNIIDDIISLIDDNKYISLSIDLYHSKSHVYYYQKEHHGHFILIKGYDNESKEFIIIDEEPCAINDLRTDFNPYVERRVPFDLIEKACLYINESTKTISFGYIEIWFKNKEQKASEKEVNSLFNLYLSDLEMNALSIEERCIDNVINFQNNFSLYENRISIYPYPEELLFFKKHIDILTTQYHVFLQMNDNLGIKSILDNYEKLLNIYNMVKSLISKSIFSKNKDILDKAASKLYHINIIERELYSQIIRLNQECSFGLLNFTRFRGQFNPSKDNLELIKDPSEIKWLILNDYYNSKAFLLQNNHESDNIKEYICNKERFLLNENFIKLVPYDYTRDVFEYKLDNVFCDNQRLILPGECYSEMIIYGFSEWDHVEDELILRYKSNDEEYITVQMSECGSPPFFGEFIGWEGYKLQLGKRLISKAYIFGKVYKLSTSDELIEIQLPDNANLHIFAVGMGVAQVNHLQNIPEKRKRGLVIYGT